MTDSIEIQLSDLRCYAHHGITESERRMGQEFRSDIVLTCPNPGRITEIGQTVDYTQVYLLFREIMSEPQSLLETVAMTLADRIHQAFPQVSEINISIQKTSPPIATLVGRVGITYRKKFDLA